MDQQPNFLDNSPAPTPPHKSISHWLIVVLAIGAVVSFFVSSYYYALWPFGILFPVMPAANKETATPVPLAQALVYKNDQYGFSIDLSESWTGYTTIDSQWEGWNVTTGENTQKGPIITLRNPGWIEEDQYEDMPIMVFTLEQWDLIVKEDLSVGAAPIPPSVLGQNSKYVLALPARYNYDYKTGWEEVDQIVHMLKASEPSPSAGSTDSPQASSGQFDVPSNWKTYTNNKYNFELKYPPGWNLQNENQPICEDTGCSGETAIVISPINGVWMSVEATKSSCSTLLLHDWALQTNSTFSTMSKTICENELFVTLEFFDDTENKEMYKNYLDQILSTFRFIERPSSFMIPPAGYSWQTVLDKDRLFKSVQAYYDDGKSGGRYGGISFIGKEWIYKSDKDSTGPKFPRMGTDDDKMMAQNGWLTEINYNGYRITGLEADGPGSSDWGYVKLENKKLSVILFNYRAHFNGPETSENMLNCPCDYEYRVFLGDPVDVDLVLPH